MMINDSTVMNRLPISVTAQRGMLSKNPQSSIAVTIALGNFVLLTVPMPEARIIVDITPCAISNRAIIRSRP